MTFKKKLFVEYPIPEELSIWGGDGAIRTPLASVDDLIESVVDEVASDILLTAYIEGTSMAVDMPKGTVTCTSAMLTNSYPFQGNRLVKVTYDKGNNRAYLRYFPAIITYQRKLQVSDLDEITGDRLNYLKAYTLYKMATRELVTLRSANMNVDNAVIDLTALDKFATSNYERFLKLKEEILIYASAN